MRMMNQKKKKQAKQDCLDQGKKSPKKAKKDKPEEAGKWKGKHRPR